MDDVQKIIPVWKPIFNNLKKNLYPCTTGLKKVRKYEKFPISNWISFVVISKQKQIRLFLYVINFYMQILCFASYSKKFVKNLLELLNSEIFSLIFIFATKMKPCFLANKNLLCDFRVEIKRKSACPSSSLRTQTMTALSPHVTRRNYV